MCVTHKLAFLCATNKLSSTKDSRLLTIAKTKTLLQTDLVISFNIFFIFLDVGIMY